MSGLEIEEWGEGKEWKLGEIGEVELVEVRGVGDGKGNEEGGERN